MIRAGAIPMLSRHSVQVDVEDFHRVVCGIVDETTPAIRRPELRAALIEEEAAETVAAIRAGDLIEAIDGMCDLLCVVYGTAAGDQPRAVLGRGSPNEHGEGGRPAARGREAAQASRLEAA
jgi:predicted HAD superfamily Cof-like phosphohydrolase